MFDAGYTVFTEYDDTQYTVENNIDLYKCGYELIKNIMDNVNN